MEEKLKEKSNDAKAYGTQCKKYEQDIASLEDELQDYKSQVFELAKKMEDYERRQISDYNEI